MMVRILFKKLSCLSCQRKPGWPHIVSRALNLAASDSKTLLRRIFLWIFLLLPALSHAVTEQYPFNDIQQQQDFAELTRELRCLVCQNQDLADSNAPLAVDLRADIYQQLRQGKSKQAVINYMTLRYGDFVLYKPPVKASTYVLWFGPFIMLLVALGVLVAAVKRHNRI